MSGLRRAISTAAALLLSSAFVLAEDDASKIVPPPSRDVTPAGVTPAPAGDGPLIREEVPPPPPDPPRWRRFFLPATTDAATFKTAGLTIHISGVAPPSADAVCGIKDGAGWPCGRSALFSFRLFLRGRAVECFFPRPEDVEEIVAPCRVGKTDLGFWLLSQGWVTPDGNATDDYRKAARLAECTGRGIWRGTAPPADCPQG